MVVKMTYMDRYMTDIPCIACWSYSLQNENWGILSNFNIVMQVS